mgnify:CR=1 FL=1
MQTIHEVWNLETNNSNSCKVVFSFVLQIDGMPIPPFPLKWYEYTIARI